MHTTSCGNVSNRALWHCGVGLQRNQRTGWHVWNHRQCVKKMVALTLVIHRWNWMWGWCSGHGTPIRQNWCCRQTGYQRYRRGLMVVFDRNPNLKNNTDRINKRNVDFSKLPRLEYRSSTPRDICNKNCDIVHDFLCAMLLRQHNPNAIIKKRWFLKVAAIFDRRYTNMEICVMWRDNGKSQVGLSHYYNHTFNEKI